MMGSTDRPDSAGRAFPDVAGKGAPGSPRSWLTRHLPEVLVGVIPGLLFGDWLAAGSAPGADPLSLYLAEYGLIGLGFFATVATVLVRSRRPLIVFAVLLAATILAFVASNALASVRGS